MADPEAIAAGIDRHYRGAGRTLDAAGCTVLFVERAREYGASITIVGPAGLPGAVARCAGTRKTLAAPGVNPAWICEVPTIAPDDPSRHSRDLDGIGTVVTACALAIARPG